MSFARRSPLTSRSSRAIRCESTVEVPGRRPKSISGRFTQPRNDSAPTPSSRATRVITPQPPPVSQRISSTIRSGGTLSDPSPTRPSPWQKCEWIAAHAATIHGFATQVRQMRSRTRPSVKRMKPLSPRACRVLGSLLEKEVTVPATYPLTMNALRSACSQASGRDPILSLDEPEITTAVAELRTAGLARLVHASHGSRTVKHRQAATEQFELDEATRAVLTLLLLRGPQTPGELRSRSDRLHSFGSLDEVQDALTELGRRDDPLVVLLPRSPGHKEARWAHLLAGPVVEATGAASPTSTTKPEPIPVPPQVAALAAFVGAWVGRGDGNYPTIEPFTYTEEIDLRPVAGKAMLAYRSATRAEDGRTLHGESGFLRLVGDGLVELIVAQGSGIVEVAEGLLDRTEILLASRVLTGSSTAKAVTTTERRYQVDGDQLTYEIAMAAVGQPLLPHLRASLTRRP